VTGEKTIVNLAEAAALLASFVLGALFLLAAARPPRGKETEKILWPALLGTGLHDLTADERLRLAVELASRADDARIPVLLCAREQETDPRIAGVVERALGNTGRPLIGEPQSPT
jgi:hypothetical protein